jgi:hypothetical protein
MMSFAPGQKIRVKRWYDKGVHDAEVLEDHGEILTVRIYLRHERRGHWVEQIAHVKKSAVVR